MRKRRDPGRSAHKYVPYRGRGSGGRGLWMAAAVLLVFTALAVGLLLGRMF